MNEDKFRNEVLSCLRIIIILLSGILGCLFAKAQTWPDSTCVDRPYTKGNDDIIYHTGKCNVAFVFNPDTSNYNVFYSDSATSTGSWSATTDSYQIQDKKDFIIRQKWIGGGIPDIFIKIKPGQKKLWCPFDLRYENIERVKKELIANASIPIRFKNGKLYKDQIRLSDYR